MRPGACAGLYRERRRQEQRERDTHRRRGGAPNAGFPPSKSEVAVVSCYLSLFQADSDPSVIAGNQEDL